MRIVGAVILLLGATLLTGCMTKRPVAKAAKKTAVKGAKTVVKANAAAVKGAAGAAVGTVKRDKDSKKRRKK